MVVVGHHPHHTMYFDHNSCVVVKVFLLKTFALTVGSRIFQEAMDTFYENLFEKSTSTSD